MSLSVYTDGWPLSYDLIVAGAGSIARLSANDLLDLRYCIDRVLQQVEQSQKSPDATHGKDQTR